MRFYLGLRGFDEQAVKVAVEGETGHYVSETVCTGETRWISAQIADQASNSEISLRIHSTAARPFGIEGFILCEEADHRCRMQVLTLLARDLTT